MPRYDLPPTILVTRNNLSWAVERSGYSLEYLTKLLEEAERDDFVCTVTCRKNIP